MPQAPHWHGTLSESNALLEALEHNCNCETNPQDGTRMSTCGAHQMLLSDQRALDGLVFARRMAERFTRKEFGE